VTEAITNTTAEALNLDADQTILLEQAIALGTL